MHPTILKFAAIFRVYVLGCVCAVLAPFAHGLTPTKPFRNYVIDSWSIEHGLPQLSVLSIAQDDTGYIWVTTQDGAARFDGVRFHVFDLDNTPALRANIVERVVRGDDGTLWFGTARGLSRFTGATWETVRLVDEGSDLAVTGLLPIDGNRLLVATERGLFEVEDGRALNVGVPSSTLRSVVVFNAKRYVASGNSVIEINGKQSRDLALPAGVSVNVLASSGRAVYAGTTRGVYRLISTWETPPWAEPLKRTRVEAIQRDGDGNLWIGTTEGLYRYHPDRGLEHAVNSALPANSWISSIFEDREGNLWVGSLTHGLHRLWNGWSSRFSTEDGLSDPFVWSVMTTDAGLYIGTNTGLEILRSDGRIRPITSTLSLFDASVYNIYAEHTGSILIGTRGGMARWNGEALVSDPAWATLGTAGVRAFAEPVPGRLLIASSVGLFEQRGETWRQIGADQGLSESRIRALGVDNDSVWIGTERGLFSMRGMQVTAIKNPAAIGNALITGLHVWRDDRVVVTTSDAGLFIGGSRGFHHLNADNGLPFNNAFSALVFDTWLYVSSAEGVYRIELSELQRFEQRGGRIGVEMVLQTSGRYPGALRTRCCNGGAQARVAEFQGALWYPTLDGVVRLDTDSIRRSVVFPTAVIETVEHSGVVHDARGKLALDGRTGDVAIAFTGLAMQDPTGLRFRYRLDGYDEEWRYGDDRRVAYYTNLAPGTYTFQVMATSSALLDSRDAAEFTFRLVPPFYRAWWFRLLIVLLALALLAYLSHSYRSRQMRRERALEAQIAQRTTELNRANERLRAANRALIEESQSDALTALRNRRFLASYMADWRRSPSAQRSQRLAFAVLDIDYFKSINDLYGHLAGDEVLRQLAQVLTSAAGAEGIALRWGGEEFMLVMPAETILDSTAYCEQLRRSIAEYSYALPDGQQVRITASIGFALFPALADRSDTSDWNLSLELADAGLYHVKAHGRNGWAIVHARAHAKAADLGTSLSARLNELVASGLLLVESSRSSFDIS